MSTSKTLLGFMPGFISFLHTCTISNVLIRNGGSVHCGTVSSEA